eukprot:1862221-Rhodomonas_salina.2
MAPPAPCSAALSVQEQRRKCSGISALLRCSPPPPNTASFPLTASPVRVAPVPPERRVRLSAPPCTEAWLRVSDTLLPMASAGSRSARTRQLPASTH